MWIILDRVLYAFVWAFLLFELPLKLDASGSWVCSYGRVPSFIADFQYTRDDRICRNFTPRT